jgi:anti-anti-sigma factor
MTADGVAVISVAALRPGLTEVRAVGDLDLRAVQTDCQLAQLLQAPPKHLRIDARRVTFMDSNGLAALIAVALAVKKNDGIVSMRASAAVRRVVELCGVSDYLGLVAPSEARTRRVSAGPG